MELLDKEGNRHLAQWPQCNMVESESTEAGNSHSPRDLGTQESFGELTLELILSRKHSLERKEDGHWKPKDQYVPRFRDVKENA